MTAQDSPPVTFARRTCDPMVLMILSNSEVRSAWKAFHCRQHRKMTIAASGRPLWKPTSPAQDNGNLRSEPEQSAIRHVVAGAAKLPID